MAPAAASPAVATPAATQAVAASATPMAQAAVPTTPVAAEGAGKAPAPTAPAKESPPKAPARPAAPAPESAPSPRLAARLDAGRSLLEQSGEGRFVVQLMMTDARESKYLESYLGEASRTLPADALFLYPSGSGESPKTGVIYGTFPSQREATQALEALPSNLRRFRPYVRPMEAVRSDVRREAPA